MSHFAKFASVRGVICSNPGSLEFLVVALRCLALVRVYQRRAGGPVFVEVSAPSDEEVKAVLHKIIGRILKMLTRRGELVEEQGAMFVADDDGDLDDARTLRPLQAATCTYRIAFGPRAGQKWLTVQG